MLPGQSSALVRPLLETNAWAVLAEGARGEPGEEVEAVPLHSLPFDGDGVPMTAIRVRVKLFGRSVIT